MLPSRCNRAMVLVPKANSSCFVLCFPRKRPHVVSDEAFECAPECITFIRRKSTDTREGLSALGGHNSPEKADDDPWPRWFRCSWAAESEEAAMRQRIPAYRLGFHKERPKTLS